jgi:hypothetical protein
MITNRAMRSMLREGLAEPGEFNIREIDDGGETDPRLQPAGRDRAGPHRRRLTNSIGCRREPSPLPKRCAGHPLRRNAGRVTALIPGLSL